jgi:hypothetical protein|tara:strand:- start:1274 stop:1675 length:402 start_codon:yes stop_codon:yes gene_type:complete
VILLSKYFSNAKENKKIEKTEINMEGIKVKREKNVIYFLLATDPLIFISFFKEFFISLKIIRKKINNKIILKNNRYCKFVSFNFIKLLSIKVKKVKNPIDKVARKIITINIFVFINLIIDLKSYKISYKFTYE